jgi:hypothetical protein
VTVTISPDSGTPAAPVTASAAGTGRVAGILGGHLFFYGLVWAGLGALLLTVNLVADGVSGEVDGSQWDGQATVFHYAMVAAGVTIVTGYLPVIVAQGVTRRTAADGGLVTMAGLAVAGAVLTTLAFVIEALVFSVNDWPHVLTGDRDMHIYDQPDQYGLILLEIAILFVTHALAGMVMAAGVFRFGWVRGAGWLVAGAAIAATSEYLMGSGFVGVRIGDALGIDAPPVGVGVAGSLALAAVAVLATRWLARGMPIPIRYASWWR